MVLPQENKFKRPLSISLLVLSYLVVKVRAQSGKLPTMGGAMSWVQKKFMDSEEYDFPETLDEFGYYFNAEGQLRQKETDEPFDFRAIDGNYSYNQKRYTVLGDVITEYIYTLMEKQYKLQRTYVPLDAAPNEPRSFVFHSGDLYTNDKMMILIHGSGAVRAGQWARRLIINDCLDSGSQLPYIKWARENKYSVLVANPNINTVEHESKKKGPPQYIRGNGSPEEHVESLWRDFVQRSHAKSIAIVAHSYGGVCVLELVKRHLRECEERVFAIALTDSVHGMRQKESDPDVVNFYKAVGVNWASAYDDLDVPLITSNDEVPTVSAGTDKHERTSYTSMESIFKYIKQRLREKEDPTMEKFVVPKREPPSEDQPPLDRKAYWAKKEEEKIAKEEAKKAENQENAEQAAGTKDSDSGEPEGATGGTDVGNKDDDEPLIDLSEVKSEL